MRLSRLDRYLIVLVIAIGIFIAEIIGGYYSNSLSLLSDAFHVLVDIPAYAVTLLAEYLVKKRQVNEARCRGYCGVFSAFLLMTAGCGVIHGAHERMAEQVIIATDIMLPYAVIGCVGNAVMIFITHQADVCSHNHQHANISHGAQAWHVWSDFGQSLAVIIGGLYMSKNGIYTIDAWLSIAIGAWMIIGGCTIAYQSMNAINEA